MTESEIDRSPARLSASVALIGAALSLAATSLSSVLAAAVAAVGLASLSVGAFGGSRRAVTLGVGGLLAAVLIAGWNGAAAEPMLFAAVAAVVAGDTGLNGISLGEQLGRAANTRRTELVHSASSLVVGSLTVAVGYGGFLAATGGQPVTALVFLLLGVVAIASALRR